MFFFLEGRSHPASDRCKHVGHPQNPSPPSTTIFLAVSPDISIPPAPPGCRTAAVAAVVVVPLVADAPAVDNPSCRAAMGALDPPEPVGVATNEDVRGETKPSVVVAHIASMDTAAAENCRVIAACGVPVNTVTTRSSYRTRCECWVLSVLLETESKNGNKLQK